jgi:hypothetical protein
MFNIGDKVVCMDATTNINKYKRLAPLIQYDIYEVESTSQSVQYGKVYHSVALVGIKNRGYNINRFVHVSEFRAKKILKLKEKICTKSEIR